MYFPYNSTKLSIRKALNIALVRGRLSLTASVILFIFVLFKGGSFAASSPTTSGVTLEKNTLSIGGASLSAPRFTISSINSNALSYAVCLSRIPKNSSIASMTRL